MHFIDDVYFSRAECRGEVYGFAKLADIFDAIVGGAVDFDNVKGALFFEGTAVRACAAGFESAFSMGTVYGFGKESSDGRFSGAAGTGKEVGLREQVSHNRIRECRCDMRLSGEIAPAVWSVFSVERCHGRGMKSAE